MDMSKDFLLHKADALLAQARRIRKLSASQLIESDRHRLVRDAEEMEARAGRLEKEAVSAKNGVFGGLSALASPGARLAKASKGS
jgi:hypothetical protein